MYKRSLLKRNIKPSRISAKIFNQFSVTSAWRNSWTQLFGSRNDWLILAAWLLLLSVSFVHSSADAALAAFWAPGRGGRCWWWWWRAQSAGQALLRDLVSLVHPFSQLLTVALPTFCREGFSYSNQRREIRPCWIVNTFPFPQYTVFSDFLWKIIKPMITIFNLAPLIVSVLHRISNITQWLDLLNRFYFWIRNHGIYLNMQCSIHILAIFFLIGKILE